MGTITLQTFTVQSATVQSYTFTSIQLGTGNLVVGIGLNGGANATAATVTVNGVTASKMIRVLASTTGSQDSSLWIVNCGVQTGNVVVSNAPNNSAGCGCAVWLLSDDIVTTGVATAFATASPPTTSVGVQNLGVGCGVVSWQTSGLPPGSAAWTGLTINSATNDGSQGFFSSAATAFATTATQTISSNVTGGSVCLVVASFSASSTQGQIFDPCFPIR